MRAAIFLLLMPFSSAQAFTLLYSDPVTTTGWQTESLVFDIDTSCDSFLEDVRSAINPAIDLWNGAPTSALKLSIGQTVTLPNPITTYVGSGATQNAPVGNPIIYCDTAFEANSGADADSIPGFAAAQNMLNSGRLQGGLLVLNFESGADSNVGNLSAELSAIVLAHEMGHVLGLGHSSDTKALMYYSTSAGRKLILAQDDLDGLSYLYPRQEPGTGGFLGCATVSAASGSPPTGLFELAILFLIAAWAVYRPTGPFKDQVFQRPRAISP